MNSEEKIEKLNNFSNYIIKLWYICFAILIAFISIPGYIHLIEIYNTEIPLELHSTTKIVLGYFIHVFIVFAFVAVLLKLTSIKFNIKLVVLEFLTSMYGVAGALGVYSAIDKYPDIERLLILFLMILVFMIGFKSSVNLIKDNKPKEEKTQ